MAIFIQSKADLEQQLILMRTQKGWPIRALARHVALSRNLVRRILRTHDEMRTDGHDLLPMPPRGSPTRRARKLDPFEGTLQLFLEKYPRITGQRLFEEISLAGYVGGISNLRERLRPTPKQTPVIRFETEPGIQGQMDWSPYTIKFLTTGKAEVLCFSYILGFSRRQFVDFTLRRDFFTLIRRHHDAFASFDGVPAP